MAKRDEQESEIRRNFLRRTSSLLFDFPKTYHGNLSLSALDDIPNPVTRDVDMVLREQSASTGSNPNYTAFQLSLELGKKEDAACKATYYIGGICCLMPEVTDDILEGVRQSGSRLRIERVPSGAVEISHQKANAFFGYLVIMLYKDITHEAITNKNSDGHLKELFDAAGYVPKEGEDGDLPVVFKDVQHVMDYLGYGKQGRIKESVLKGVLNHINDKDSFGDVCSYVARVLSWTGMTGFYNVYKTLVFADSHVLTFRGLPHEIANLHRAVEAVFNTDMPQYFRILGDRSKYHLVEISKFPMLVAVSERIMSTSNDANFSPFGPKISEIDYHVAIHRNQLADAFKANVMQLLNDRAQDDED